MLKLRNNIYGISVLAVLGLGSAFASEHEAAAAETKPAASDDSLNFVESIVNPRYFGVMGFRTEPDNDRTSTDYGVGMHIFLGRELSESLNTELAYTATVFETSGSGSDFYQHQLGVDVLYVFDRVGFQPYVLGGGGVLHDDILLDNKQDSTNGYLNAGVGFIGSPATVYDMSIRGDVRYVHDFNYGGLGDIRAGLGLMVPFGRAESVSGDSDGDGVADNDDRCPGTMRGLQVDGRGCAIVQTMVLNGVSFDFSSTRLGVNAMTILDEVASTMQGQPSMKVEIAGHTDNIGADSYNKDLSQRRADAVRQYLVSKGTSADSLRATGYGEVQPIASNTNDLDRERNRRVEFRIEVK